MPSASGDTAPDAGSIRVKRLRLGVVVFGVLVILAFAASSAYDARSSYRYARAATEREISNTANALAEQTAWILRAVDLLLLDTARWYSGETNGMSTEQLDAALAIRTAAVQQVRQLRIVDARGNPLYESHKFSAPSPNVADRSYFTAQQDGTAQGMFMSGPLVTRTEGRAGVTFSRRLDDQNGRFAGVVTALVDLEDLNQFYRAVNVGMGGAIQLIRDDGTLLVRNPRTPDALGKAFPALAAGGAVPQATLVNPIDGQSDFIAVALVANTRLRIAVTRESAAALQPWRSETIRVAARTLVLTLLGALTIVALLSQLRRVAAGERALRESEAQLRQSQKMEAIGTLAGGIAHDFNNILGAILGYGELALQHCTEKSELRRYLDNIMHATERAKLLVERILGFSRSGLGDRVPVNVESVVVETLELLQASLPSNIRLQTKIDAANAAVIGDATYLHQVAMNLCTNAVQAMESGGLLSVVLDRAEVRDPRTLFRGSIARGSYVRLMVSDTGSGIAPAVLDRMFDPFFTTKEVGEGTGLGLSLVHGIVTDLGGAIDVATSVGAGTRFEIWLPVTGESVTAPVEDSGSLPRGHGETVMIVDDERPLVDLAEEIIANLGYEPVGFASSGAALEAFRAAPERFDVVLTDESMPELIGTELAQAIRRLRPGIPIILMTGYGGTQLANRAADIGLSDVLRKPLHRRDLADSLARVFEAVD
jgi:signal transduction histidine kinase